MTILIIILVVLGSKTTKNTVNGPSDATKWKPSFLSEEEFVHLMLEAIDGFILVISLDDHGRILYASEGVAWLLGHLPSTLIENNTSLFDITAEEDAQIIKDILDQSLDKYLDEEERPRMEFFVHMEKGGANKVMYENARHELVKLSGYFAKWASSVSPCHSKDCTDENCLPGKFNFWNQNIYWITNNWCI